MVPSNVARWMRLAISAVHARGDDVLHRLASTPGKAEFAAYRRLHAAGDFAEAMRRLDGAIEAAPDRAELRFERLVQTRLGLVPVATAKADLERMRRHRRADVRLRATISTARLLWEREGPTQDAVIAARAALKDSAVSDVDALRMAALLNAAGRTLEAAEKVARLARRTPDIGDRIRYVELAATLARLGHRVRHGDLALRIVERLDADAGTFARMVGEACRDDVAIVANGPCEVGSGHGADIDSRRVVIRFNNFYDQFEHTRDYGRRADVWFRHGFDEEVRPRPLDGIRLVVVLGADPRHRYSDGIDLFTRFLDKPVALETVPFAVYRSLFEILDASPSSGLVGLAWAHRLLGRLPSTAVFGFAPQLNSERRAVYADTKVEVTVPGRHNWSAEARFIPTLINPEVPR